MLKIKKIGLIFFAFFIVAGEALSAPVPESFADLAEKLLPTVVNISTSQKVKGGSMPLPRMELPQGFSGSPFEEMFKDFFDGQGLPNQSERKVTSLGSGFIIDKSGIIVTNNHVVERADKISVILSDKTTLDAEVIGRDKKTDIALLKVKAKTELKAVSFGDSETVRIGDWVLTIGNPFGLGNTVTAGIISARARDIQAGPYDDFLQTDASINRGNSGGPMFNLKGEVIGVNTAIFSPSGGSVGIGFAIPSNMAKWVVSNLQKYGRIKRGWIGVRIQNVSEEIRESLGLAKASGALVASVNDDGPAAKAGVEAGDIILRFSGYEVTEMRNLPRLVAETKVGDVVEIDVWRGGKQKKLKITVGEMPEEKADAEEVSKNDKTSPKNDEEGSKIDNLGLTLAPLSENLRKRFNLDKNAKGLVVTEVDRDGDAATKGVVSGDRVVEVNQKPVTSIDDVKKELKAVKEMRRASVLLLVDGASGLRFVAVKISDAD